MYAFIKGILVEASPATVVVEANGIGYEINIPISCFSKLPATGHQVMLFTSFIVRENAHSIFGFLSQSEKGLYELLMSVSGIGPKLGLALIGHLSVGEIQQAVCNCDLFVLSKVPGIGKRTAERLVLELKDKISTLFPRDMAIPREGLKDSKDQKLRDAVSALVNLGYNQATAQKAIQKALKETSESVDLPALITKSLSYI